MLKNNLNKMNVSLLVIFFIGISFVNLSAGDSFAPKVKLPGNMENRSMWAKVIKDWKVPSKSEVGIPAYPGAFIVGLKGMSHMTANGIKYNTLPTIVLATTTVQKKVAEFYKEKLNKWRYMNDMDMFDVFWNSSGKFNSMDIRQTATMPNIIIMKASLPYTEYMPNAKTVITIVYKTVK